MRLLPFVIAAVFAGPAAAQVEVTSLAAPDYFSQGARDTGMPSDLWRGTSPAVAASIIPAIGRKPLSPAARDLARKLLATAAVGPDGAGREPDVAAARIQALLALGSPGDAWAAADRAGNLPTNPALAEAVAETALIVGEDDRACRIADDLSVGRGEVYWLRLRAYCQARAGQHDAAQLTLTLASEKQRDPTVSRLIGAMISGVGDPGAASARNGLEFSLSRRLALDLAAIRSAPPAIMTAIAGGPPLIVTSPPTLAQRFVQPEGRTAELDALLREAASADPKVSVRYQSAALVAVALGAAPTPDQRAALAAYQVQPGLASPARLTALSLAADAEAKGEVALQVLAIVAEADGKPLRPADSAAIVAALRRVGFADHAIAFAGEAFAALQIG